MRVVNYYRCYCSSCKWEWSSRRLWEHCPKCSSDNIFENEDAYEVDEADDEDS